MARYWYGYLGGSITDPSNYIKLDPQDDCTMCSNGHTLCAIYAIANPTNDTKPATVSNNIQSYIPLSTGTLAAPYPFPPNGPFVCPQH